MIRPAILTAFALFTVWASPPIPGRLDIYLNKEGVRVETIPPAWLERARNALRLDRVEVAAKMEIPHIAVAVRPLRRVRRIVTTVDLRPFFADKECIRDWDLFHDCMNRRTEKRDERLYRKIDREFVSKILCREGCIDPSFLKWRFHWRSPALLQLEADIGGAGAFKTVDEAKRSLHKINELLKKTLYGARFPEEYGEGRSEFERYSRDEASIVSPGFGDKLVYLLERLRNEGYLKGFSERDMRAVRRLAGGGKTLFYLPLNCRAEKLIPGGLKTAKPGWHAVSNAVHLHFDSHRCPQVTVLR